MNAPAKKLAKTRTEKDLLGIAQVPADAFFGIQTQRAMENFNLSGIQLHHFPNLVKALAIVKLAAAQANAQLGQLEKKRFEAIDFACREIIAGKYHDQFVVDMIQGGAGTSTNMNANEVIANVGLGYLGHNKGEYQYLHPNNDVNMAQSTNDAYPTAIRLSVLLDHGKLVGSLRQLKRAFKVKSVEFADVIKMGRTQLQDAVPMTLGQEFRSYASTLSEDIDRIADLSELFLEVNLGGTAIGTGINTDPQYAHFAVECLADVSQFSFRPASDLVEASSDMGAFVLFSGMLKRLAIKLSKICNDLRLLSSGPRTGLNEINLPPQQPGSSIMPGKVNPVIPEAVNQVAFQIIGNDMAITMAAEAGQLQLNVMEPLIAYNILESMRLLSQAMDMLRTRCIEGITANAEHCKNQVNNSIGIITALNPYIGYDNATRIARQAQEEGCSVLDLVRQEKLLDEKTLEDILRPETMVAPGRLRK
ncbi:aspartate ammonia-lyase [Oceanospirillum sediminis]|uniref:Aspartate ammonia-lyase n=1 Tax=Oceanospirillum sediminis TaxID=2760088 RepID=A0A839ITT8_9GAMM|nr:aspartate ammonia-lyase [Oceanospirillum sediminis]MBB1488054.1 aspartate ammonia-lyase [Oceanospirillum sediminis]